MFFIFFLTLKPHLVNDLGILMTNGGRIGNHGDFSQYEWSFEYPRGSGKEYLFGASLWVGAVVNGCYRVSYGCDGWNYYLEFFPGHQDTIYEYEGNEAVSDHDLYCVYWDTCGGTAPEYFPLGLEVHERSYVWRHAAVKSAVIIDYVIKNIGSYYLDSVHVGLYVDGDCRPVTSDEWAAWFGAQDDVTGLRVWRDPADTLWPSGTILYTWDGSGYVGSDASGLPKYTSVKDYVLTAWITDADGYNDEYSGGPSDQPDCIGCRILGPQIPTVSYNWWISDPDPALDWGPPDPSNPEDVDYTPSEPFCSFPDSAKYILLSNRFLDPDQIGPRGVNANPIYAWPAGVDSINDTRFLLSTGPFYLAPGESVRIAFALFGGYEFHNSYIINDYSFDSLVSSAWKIAYFYDIPGIDTDGDGYRGDFVVIAGETTFINGDGVPDLSMPPYFPPSPPYGFRVEKMPDRNILTWEAPSLGKSYTYNVYRSDVSGGPYTLLNTSPLDTTFFVDSIGVFPGDTLYYVVTAVDTGGLESGYSEEEMVICGVPYPPVFTSVSWGEYRQISLSWEGHWNGEEFLVWRKEESETLWALIDTVVDSYEMVDGGVVPGIRYDYFVQALYNGLLSVSSCTLTGLATSMDREILLVDCSKTSTVINDTLVDSFYVSLLTGYDWTYWENSQEDNPPPLTELVQYKLILIQDDDPYGSSFISDNERNLADYLRAGGRLMVSGFGMDYGSTDLPDYVLRGRYRKENASLIGAYGEEGYPSLSVDSALTGALYPLPLVYIFSSQDPDVKFIYKCDNENDSYPEGEPCGVLRLIKPYACLLGFPLSWMKQDSAEVAGRKIIEELLYTGVKRKKKARCLFGRKVVFEVDYTIPVKIDLFDVLGRRVRRIYQGIPGKRRFVIERKTLPPGVYFIHVSGKNVNETVK
ncbi:hypothetical protein DRQ20_06175, partial [bacterium]